MKNAERVKRMDDKALSEAWDRLDRDEGEKLYEWLNQEPEDDDAEERMS